VNRVNGERPTGGRGINVWSTTFADILTLVLSFFIATISVSPLNPASESASERQITTAPRKNEGLNLQTTVGVEGGTPLALTRSKAPPRDPIEVVELGDSDFSMERKELVLAAQEKLKSLVKTDSYHRRSIRIESCDGAGDENLGRERGLMVRRQLIDAGAPGTMLRLAVMDGSCGSIPGLAPAARARITVR